jgi:hypothetical protein
MKDYEKKYLKYKNKYLELKTQLFGGDANIEDFMDGPLTIPCKTYPLKMDKLEEYKQILQTNNFDDREIALFEEILRKTTHISFNDLLKLLKKCIEAFEKENGDKPYILYLINPGELQLVKEEVINKSNYWIAKIVYLLLNKKPTHICLNKDDINKFGINNILICDDAVYTGTQLNNNILKFKRNNDFRQSCKINLICTAMSSESFFDFNRYIKVFTNLIFKSSKELFIDNMDIFLEMNIGKESSYPIYFDHRVADYYSSLPNFYEVGKIQKNRYSEYIFFNSLLKNCEHDISGPYINVDHFVEKCPPIPYKEKSKTDEKNIIISADNFIKIFKSDFYPYLDYIKNKESGSYYIECNKIKKEKIDELLSLLEQKMKKGIYTKLYYPVSQKSIDYCLAYTEGFQNVKIFNKKFVLDNINEELKKQPNHLPIRLESIEDNIVGFTTLFSIPYLSEENVKEIKELFKTFT